MVQPAGPTALYWVPSLCFYHPSMAHKNYGPINPSPTDRVDTYDPVTPPDLCFWTLFYCGSRPQHVSLWGISHIQSLRTPRSSRMSRDFTPISWHHFKNKYSPVSHSVFSLASLMVECHRIPCIRNRVQCNQGHRLWTRTYHNMCSLCHFRQLLLCSLITSYCKMRKTVICLMWFLWNICYYS